MRGPGSLNQDLLLTPTTSEYLAFLGFQQPSRVYQIHLNSPQLTSLCAALSANITCRWTRYMWHRFGVVRVLKFDNA